MMLLVWQVASDELRQRGVILGLVLGQAKLPHFLQKVNITQSLVTENAKMIALKHNYVSEICHIWRSVVWDRKRSDFSCEC